MPSTVSASEGQPVVLSVQASGTPSPSFQWYKGGVLIEGATASTYTIKSVQESDTGTYTVTITNACGQVASDSVTLDIDTSIIQANAASVRWSGQVGEFGTSPVNATPGIETDIEINAASVRFFGLVGDFGDSVANSTPGTETDIQINSASVRIIGLVDEPPPVP